MKKAEIEAIKLEDVALIILQLCDNRITEFSLGQITDNPNLTEDENFYNRIICDYRPSISDVIQTLRRYKDELEKQRFQSDVIFYKSMEDYSNALRLSGMTWSHLWVDGINKIIEEDSNLNDYYKNVVTQHDAKVKARKEIERKALAGKLYKKACLETLELIGGVNASKGLTESEIDGLEIKYDELLKALERGRFDKAMRLLGEVPAEDYTQVEIDLFIDYLTDKINGISIN